MVLLGKLRRYMFRRPMVRPWALSAPVLVLLIALPLLRPLRHPDPRDVADDELARLATIESIAERQTLVIDEASFVPAAKLIRVGDELYSDQPPAMALLLAGPYWVMSRFGLTMDTNPNLVAYLLTVLGVTLPVALGAGLIYRMGRVFELRRPWRAAMGAAVVLGSGLISYAVVLNAHAPAAVLVLGSAACLIHVAVSKRPSVGGGWVIGAGFCAALATVIEPAAAVFALLFAAVPLAMKWKPSLKIGGLLLYLIGMTPPLFLHAGLMLSDPITGDLLPGVFHPELAVIDPLGPAMPQAADHTAPAAPAVPDAYVAAPDDPLMDDGARDSIWIALLRPVGRVLGSLLGAHGLLSHFPVLVLGVAGVFAVMHRHWPHATKVLAGATLAGAAVVVLVLSLATDAGTGSMFAARWFVLFLPLLLYWSGAWLRRSHHPVSWSLAGVLLAFSIGVALLGATAPYPRAGYDRYTAAQALDTLLDGNAATPLNTPVLAGSGRRMLP